ncbi:hypothetical protein [Promicromonospora sp. AC04]|uniref:hypothetical protein n=1 Tax=Promicromonospora sp. AC04 TaxID=2135723 RepID=UPI000D338CD9|nr:hypothetical protein [Promicromonospora sp. AC04]
MVAAAFVLLSVVAGVTWSSQRADLAGQEAQVEELVGRLADLRQQHEERLQADVLASLGISRSRVDVDTAVIESLLGVAFTWDSGPAYETARDRLKDRYGLSEDDEFLQEFMSPPRFNEDVDGQRYYYVDAAGLNSALGEDPDIEVAQVRASDYSYVVLVDVEITSDVVTQNDSSSESVTAHRPVLLFVTVDATQTVSDLRGVPAGAATLRSH